MLSGQFLEMPPESCTLFLEAFTPRLELCDRHRPRLVGVHQAIDLELEPSVGCLCAGTLLPELHRLGAIHAPSLDRFHEDARALNPLHDRAPHHSVEGIRTYLSRPARHLSRRVDGCTITSIVKILILTRERMAMNAPQFQAAIPTDNERAEKIVVLGVAPRCLRIGPEAVQNTASRLLVDERRDRNPNPLRLRSQAIRAVGLLGVRARPPRVLRPAGLAPAVHRKPRVDAIREDMIYARLAPPLALSSLPPHRVRAFRRFPQRQAIFTHPAIHGAHALCLHLLDDDDALGRLRGTNDPIAVRRVGKWQHLAGAHLVSLAASRSLKELRALVLRDHALHLHQQSILGLFADGANDEVYLCPALRQLLEKYLLIYVVAREAVRVVDKNHVDEAICHGVAQSIERRPVEASSAEALVDIASVRRHSQAHGGSGLLQGLDL